MRVLVVDDSRIFRKQVELALESIPGVEIVGSVWNGEKALGFVKENDLDLVTLDQEMPEMDGITTLREIQKLNIDRLHKVGVIMLSAYTQSGGDVTLRALHEGALDFIAKPAGGNADENMALLKHELKQKIEAWKGRTKGIDKSFPVPVKMASGVAEAKVLSGMTSKPIQRGSVIEVIAIGVSTGGPKALQELLPELSRLIDLPILIVQHMPPQFTKSLAESLDRVCEHKVVEAEEGMEIQQKTMYVAPGGHHLLVREEGAKKNIHLSDQAPENGFRPSADVLFRSVAAVYQSHCVALILTGMGSDGTKGLGPIKRQGAIVLAQDEASSVVWGMPGSAVSAGVVDKIVPLSNMATCINEIIGPKV